MTCPNCDGEELRWYVGKQGAAGIVDGRHCMREISVIAYLACEECSETLKVVGEDEVERMLNRESK